MADRAVETREAVEVLGVKVAPVLLPMQRRLQVMYKISWKMVWY